MTANDTIIQGWSHGPDTRGTFDILWSCIVVIGLCSWTSVCPNVPAASAGKTQRLVNKAWLAFIGLVGPDFLTVLAAGQWSSAKASHKVSRLLLNASFSRISDLIVLRRSFSKLDTMTGPYGTPSSPTWADFCSTLQTFRRSPSMPHSSST